MTIVLGPRFGQIRSGDEGENWHPESQALFRFADALMGCAVLDKDLTEPPADPADGDLYIVAASATDAWAGHDDEITYRDGTEAAWFFFAPPAGFRVWVIDEDQAYRLLGGWAAEPSTATGGNADELEGHPAGDFILQTEKGSADGVAELDAGGKVPSAQLPAIAITSISVVADETEQLALTAEEGDVAVRSDENKSYVHNGGTAGTMADWTLLKTPTDTVLSVFGRTGAVVAVSGDYAVADITGLAAALALLAPLASPTFTGTVTLPNDQALPGNPTTTTQASGNNSTRVATTAFVEDRVAKQEEVLIVAVGDETTAITTGTAKVTFRMPFAMTLTTPPRASLTTASSSGLPTVNIKEAGSTIFSTKITIDVSSKTSVGAATPAVLSDSALADDAEMTIDIDVAGTGAKGLKVTFIGKRT